MSEHKFKNFYCSGTPDGEFDINRWNEEFHLAHEMGVIDQVKLPGEHDCEKQCERCLNVVLDRKLLNQSK